MQSTCKVVAKKTGVKVATLKACLNFACGLQHGNEVDFLERRCWVKQCENGDLRLSRTGRGYDVYGIQGREHLSSLSNT